MANVINMSNGSNVNVVARPSEAKPIHWNQFGHVFNHKGATLQDVFDYDGSESINYNVSEMPLMRVPQEMIDAIRSGQPFDWNPTVQDIITSHKATLRDDFSNTLGVVGRDYKVIQNKAAFDFINFIEEVSGHTPNIESFGALGNGERIFITATLGEDSYLNPDDAIKNYVVFTTGHSAEFALQCMFTPIRVICANTLAMAIKGCPNRIVFKHTKNVEQRLDWQIEENRKKALKVFSESVKFSDNFIARMLNLKNQSVTADEVRDFTAKMYLNDTQFGLYQKADYNLDKVEEISTRTKNQILALRDATEFGVGQEFNRGTKVWLLNGLTTLLHNERNWKSGEDEFNSIMFGDGAKKVQKAYDMLLAA